MQAKLLAKMIGLDAYWKFERMSCRFAYRWGSDASDAVILIWSHSYKVAAVMCDVHANGFLALRRPLQWHWLADLFSSREDVRALAASTSSNQFGGQEPSGEEQQLVAIDGQDQGRRKRKKAPMPQLEGHELRLQWGALGNASIVDTKTISLQSKAPNTSNKH